MSDHIGKLKNKTLKQANKQIIQKKNNRENQKDKPPRRGIEPRSPA